MTAFTIDELVIPASIDAPDAAVERPDVQLALEFATPEGGVALRIDRLVQLERRGRARRP